LFDQLFHKVRFVDVVELTKILMLGPISQKVLKSLVLEAKDGSMITISQVEDYHVNCDLTISNDVLQSTEVLLCLLNVKIYVLPAP
jgi:hypothetical protein